MAPEPVGVATVEHCCPGRRRSRNSGRQPAPSGQRRQAKLLKKLDDKDLYKARHLVENFFCKLKQYRAIATRYDKIARNFLAAVYLAASAV